MENAILKFIGILGYGRAGISFPTANILAVNREELNKVQAALILGRIKILRVSGTIKGVRK